MRRTTRTGALVAATVVSCAAGPATGAPASDPGWTPSPGSAVAESLEDVPESHRRDLSSFTPPPVPFPSSTRCDEHTCITVRPATQADLLGTLPSEWIRCVGEAGPASAWTALGRWFTTAACLGEVVGAETQRP